jgi:hypothetical protein
MSGSFSRFRQRVNRGEPPNLAAHVMGGEAEVSEQRVIRPSGALGLQPAARQIVRSGFSENAT